MYWIRFTTNDISHEQGDRLDQPLQRVYQEGIKRHTRVRSTRQPRSQEKKMDR